MHKKNLSIVAAIMMATLAIIKFSNMLNTGKDTASAEPTQHITNKIRPEFSLPDIHGEVRSIKEWDNNYIVINFWATWCPPCLEEIPEFIALQKEYKASKLQFIGVAIDNEASVQQFALEVGMNYPSLVAGMSGIELAKQYGNSMGALPFSVIIDPEGRIIAQQIGLLERSKILATAQLSED